MKIITFKMPEPKEIGSALLYILCYPLGIVTRMYRNFKRRYRKLDAKSRLVVKLKMTLIALAIVTSLLAITCIAVYAQSKQDVSNYTVTYETAHVTPNDTLWSIAEQYKGDYPGDIRDYIEILKSVNDAMSPTTLYAGVNILVPVYQYVGN